MIDILESPGVRRRVAPISVESYHVLRDLGLVDVKTELVNGIIVEKMTKSPRHTLILHRLHDALAQGLPSGCLLRKEDPLTLAASEPEPDLAIVRGSIEDYAEQHPTTAELVVEVAVSSLELDRAKAADYAGAGIPTYWLVIPAERAIVVYTEPRAGGYQGIRRVEQRGRLATWYGAEIDLEAALA
jgi:Uma2 family endonuclease